MRDPASAFVAALLSMAALGACSTPAPEAGDQPAATTGNGAAALDAGTAAESTTIPPGGAPANVESGVAAAEAEVSRWVEEERIPGAVLVVSRGGAVVFEKAFGHAQLYAYDQGSYGAAAVGATRPDAVRRLETPIRMRVDTVFDLASVTKMMATTFAVMLLVDEGLLELDAPVQRYLPDFGSDGGDKAQITIRQLLTHRSGLSQWQPVYYSASDASQAYGFIRDYPLAWRPGAERHYSDLGFMLLGIIAERISGEPLGALARRRLYEPMGLVSTGFRPSPAPGSFAATSHGNPFEHRMVHDFEFGYRIEGDPDAWDGWRRYTLNGEVNDGNAHYAFGGEAGHAGLFSTAGEVRRLLQLLLDGGVQDGRRYLSSAVVDEFLTDAGEGQALGWLVPDYLPDGSFYHSGFTGTYVAGIPSQNTAVVLLTNRQNVGVDESGGYPDVGELQRAVATAIAGRR